MIHSVDRKSVAGIKNAMNHKFLGQKPFSTGEWQSQKIEDPMMATREVQNVSLCITLPGSAHQLAIETGCNLPWAEDHFQERVSGEPLNPPPSEAWWPYALKHNAEHKSQGAKFSHTYPERMWPRFANTEGVTDKGRQIFVPHIGIRFEYGDLEDVVQQLKKSPLTRQAYLPIWFPEDTGAVHGERVPCTLGYHFLIRDGKLTITYYIRSCDFIRHFSDDVYMAGRLAQWMVERLNEDSAPGEEYAVWELIMHISSFHIFEGDVLEVQRRVKEAQALESSRLMGLL
jgi:hypothetical protein